MTEQTSNQIPGLAQKKVFKIIVLGDSGVGKTCLTYRFCEGQFLDKSEATIGVDFRERTILIRNEEIKGFNIDKGGIPLIQDLGPRCMQIFDQRNLTSKMYELGRKVIQCASNFFDQMHLGPRSWINGIPPLDIQLLQLWDTAGQERFRKSMVQHYYRNVHAVVIVYDVTKPETFHSIMSWMQEVESHGLTNAPRVLVGNKCDCGTPESRLATTYAQRLADKYGMPLFETSALLDSECDNVESIFMTLAHKLYSKQPLRVISVEGDQSYGVVTLPRHKSRAPPPPRDSCLCS